MCICGAPRTRGARSHAFIPHDSAPQILSASTRLPPLAGRASAAASSENPRHPTHPRPGVLTAAKPAARLATVFYFFACRRCECRPRGCRAAGVRFWALAPWIRVCRPTGTCSCPPATQIPPAPPPDISALPPAQAEGRMLAFATPPRRPPLLHFLRFVVWAFARSAQWLRPPVEPPSATSIPESEKTRAAAADCPRALPVLRELSRRRPPKRNTIAAIIMQHIPCPTSIAI
jgi:hypothetical protein